MKKKIFNYLTLKKVFIFILIFLSLLPFSTVIFAQTITPGGSTPSNAEYSVDDPIPSCKVYDNYLWGVSAKGVNDGINNQGLYRSETIDGKNDNGLIANIYNTIRKDPIFFPTEYGVSDTNDPVLGLSSDRKSIDHNVLSLPCTISSLTGIVPRRKADVNHSNCKFNPATEYKKGFITSIVSCSKDNSITGGKVTGGCPIDLRFNGKDKIGKFGGGGINESEDTDLFMKFIYSDGGLISRTINFAASYEANAMKNYQNWLSSNNKLPGSLKPITLSPVNDSFYNSIKNQTINYDKNDLTKTINVNDYLLNIADNTPLTNIWGKSIGLWFSVGNNGNNNDFETTFSLDDLIPNLDSIFFINQNKLSSDINNINFKCNKRSITLKYGTNFTKTIGLYEWIPVARKSSPLCDNTLNKLISMPSSVGKSTYLMCTPCKVAALFQTDIFGSPVFGIPTGIGCLPSSINGLITVLLRISVMTAGGIAVLLISLAGIRITLNADNPDEIKKAQKSITSAVTGLLVIISAVLLLNLVGVKLLGLDMFGGNEIIYITTNTTK